MTWTIKDQRKAATQGWIVAMAQFLDKDVPTVQRVDDPQAWRDEGVRIPSPHGTPRFASDEHAQAYVRGRADAGCPLARKALRETSHVYRPVGRASDWNNLGPSLDS